MTNQLAIRDVSIQSISIVEREVAFALRYAGAPGGRYVFTGGGINGAFFDSVGLATLHELKSAIAARIIKTRRRYLARRDIKRTSSSENEKILFYLLYKNKFGT